VIHLENGRQLRANLHRLSITGGLLELATYTEERVSVTLIFQLGSDILKPRAEMLFPVWMPQGYLQPFRFTALRPEEHHLLEKEIGELLKQAMAGQGLGFRPPSSFLESF
jgi:hypothetical protein